LQRAITTKGTKATIVISFAVNGARKTLAVHSLRRLLDVLREDCGLTGTKEGCGEGECGACTVLIDGAAVNSCLIPVAHANGTRVTTIEGLGGTHPLQRAFVEHGGAQCGICTPGMIMAAVALGKKPTLDEIRVGLAGNLCRCTGYMAIYRSIENAEKGNNRKERKERRVKKSQRSRRHSGRISRNASKST
jgi:aerobic-type carbon monoxide dehydrogenase small subunit (CoxS/CutS family)